MPVSPPPGTSHGVPAQMHSSESSEICWYLSREDSQILKIMSKPSVTPWVSSPPGLPILNVSVLTTRMCKIETNGASSISGSARSGPSLEQVHGSTVTGSHGPGSPDDNRNTRRRLDTVSNPDDESARSAVLSQFPCEQFHAGVSRTLNKFLATANIW